MALHNSNGTADGSRSHGEGPMNGHGDGKDGQQQQLSSDSSLLHRRSGSSSSSSMANHGAPNNGNALRRNSATSEDGDDSIDDDSSAFTPLYDGSSIDKREFVRLTIQSLKELGFESAAKALAMESGFKMEHPSILAFRQAVLSGDWRSAERLLFDGLNSAASRIAARSAIAGTSSSAGLDLVLRDPRHLGIEHIKFLIDQQRYLELLEARQTKKALSILRDRLAPHNAGTDRLHHLSSLVICASPEELRARAKWPGAGVTSRTELLHAIESAVLPSIMVPSRRLPELLEQAQLEQKRSDPYFNLPLDTHVSLYTDKVSDRSSFPTDTAAILTGHTDEVLHVAFSNSGTKLATAGKDKMVIVWSVGGRQSDFEVLHRLGPHLAAVWSVAWSPDDKSLLSTTVDGDVAVWNIEDGSRKEYAKHHYEAAGAWLPDGRHFLTASMDASVVIWDNAEEKKLHTWKTSPFRVLAFDVSPNGRYLAAVSHRAIPSRPSGDGRTPGTAGTSSTRSYSYSESPSPLSMMTGNADDRPTTSHAYRDVNEDQFSANGGPEGRARGEDGRSDTGGGNRVLTDEKYRLSFYDVEAREELGSIYFYEEMSSVCFSHDSQQILVNRKPNEAQLWDFQRQSLLRRYTGHQIARNVIRSCFGGATRNFVLSGSEDAKIYVYHRRSGQLLDRLAGHGEGCVNSVAWHPWDFALFASASDDTTVRIWRPKRLLGTALGVEEEAAGRLRRQMDELERSGNSPSIGNGVGHTVRRRSAVNGEGRATGQGATNGSTSRSSDARDSSVDLDMMGPTPFPWSVSPQHPSTSTMGRDTDENGDISMAAGSSREQQHPQARGYSSPLSTPGRRRRIRGGSGGTGTRRFMETVGGMEVEVDEDEEDEGEGDEDEDEEDGEEEDDEEGVEGEEDDEDDEDEEGEGEEVMEEAD